MLEPVSRLVLIIAALALLFSPVSAFVASSGCDMQSIRASSQDMEMAMPMAREGGGGKSSGPCCKHDKACVMACGQSCAPVATLPSGTVAVSVSAAPVRRAPVIQLEPASFAPPFGVPPPRTLA